MIRVEGQIVIERPIEDVFDFVADARNEPRYNPNMRRVEKVSDGQIGVGTRFAAETASRGRPIDMVIEFTGFERPRLIEESVHMSSMDLQGRLTFDAIPEGTRMRWAWDLTPRGLLTVMRPLVARIGRRQQEAVWGGLKHLLEAADEPIEDSHRKGTRA
jgi:uncharacterized protein YndB with AHSA1/START domain